MDRDHEILQRIHDLVDEEDRLREAGDGLDPDERARLEQIEVALDQCWDLMRQRRARREFGHEPDDAAVRSPEVVERYVQ